MDKDNIFCPGQAFVFGKTYNFVHADTQDIKIEMLYPKSLQRVLAGLF